MHILPHLVRAALVAALLFPAAIHAGKIPIKKDEVTNAVTETVNFTGTVSIGGTSLGALPLTHEKGGLEADVSAYSGLVKITGGATSAVTITSAGEAILDDANAAAQRTTLGLGTIATQAANSVAITGGTISGITSLTATGGTISGITDLAVADGGTGVSSLSDVLGTSNQITVTSGTARVIGGNVTLAIAAVLDLGANTSVEIPNGTTPTVDAAGEIAIDTNGDGTNVTQGLITYYDGTTQLYAAAYDTAPATDGHVLTYDSGTNKLAFEAIPAVPKYLVFQAVPDATTLTTGVKKTFVVPENMTLLEVYANTTTAPGTTGLEVDITEASTSIFTTTMTIDDGTTTTHAAATPSVLATTSFTAGDILEIEILSVDATPGTGLTVYLRFTEP